MVIVDYRGPDHPRRARITSRAELADCIIWLQEVLDEMELHDREGEVVIDLKDYEDNGI